MARYEVRVRLFDVEDKTPWQARSQVEEQLRTGGVQRWRIVDVRPQGPRRRRRSNPASGQVAGGMVLIATVVGWWLWFWMNLL